ncbi:M48 family metallopeptidase [Candidatus Omnitrophota bacterium]
MVKIKIDKIVRSKRKTLALEISRDASLIVRAPKKTPLEYIEKIIQKKRFWIQRKQKTAYSKYRSFIPKEFVNGEGFLFLGDSYRLSIEDIEQPPLTLDKEFRLSRKYLSEGRRVFIEWYRKEAYKKIEERLNWYSYLSGLKCSRFNITNAQKRWGSCNAKGNLCFSWRLIMAPLRVLDYVVVHELAHLEERNHSIKFWSKVKIIMPDYEKYNYWLRDNEYLLAV